MLGDRHIAVDAPRRGGVPARQRLQNGPESAALRRPDPALAEIGVELIPGVSHGGEAVAEVPGAPGLDDGFRRAVARADHQIVVVEVELLDHCREQREAIAIVAPDAGQILQHGCLRTRRSMTGDTLPGT